MNASMFGHEEIVQELLQAGADVNAENEVNYCNDSELRCFGVQ